LSKKKNLFNTIKELNKYKQMNVKNLLLKEENAKIMVSIVTK